MWIRLDDNFADHPKIIKAGPLAVVAQIRALCYVARHLTDGYFSTQIALTICADLTPLNPRSMVQAKLWLSTKQGFKIKDFLEYNPDRRTILQLRENRRKAGQAGGQASAQANARYRAQHVLDTDFNSSASASTPSPKSSKKSRTIAPAMEPNGPAPIGQELTAVIKRMEARNPGLVEEP